MEKNFDNSLIQYNKVNFAGSLIREPYYLTNKKMTSEDMMRLKKIVDEKNNKSDKKVNPKKLYFIEPNCEN